ncbi:hypothetical protein HYH03_015748 [Edaphochlamys debaryana]|uniref:Guanylate cyclase domain-containing protein n=1 Tax=Edaphochlamys debaryana TaxID=47281 RepID=A0A835XLP5_9CHLO|nr:hypothetical protein HYH03_015748 [Edaphochlamys debaryana]|eukprot:KAG2485587.1 hypothetical protein HYH03_015748 [Edaphochlamys debaryana]
MPVLRICRPVHSNASVPYHLQLLYRRDIFEQYNLSVPATWDDALDIADKYGRGALGPGQPDMGFCFESNPGAAYAMLSAFTAPAEHFRAALLPFTEVSPIRYRELDAREWIIAGYNPADLDDFLAQHRISFDSENVYYELRIPGTFQTYTLVERVLRRYNANNYTYEELMAWANEGTDLIFASLGGRDRLRPLYQGSIGYKPPPPPPAPSSGGSSSAPLLIAVLVPSLVSLDSTCLWESLPASVMDVALKTHHRVIRQLLIQHAGYESATEGDSFILAFAKPDRALAFALSAQDALLAAEWPGELLDSAHAPTLVVTHDTTACAAAQLSIAGPALWKEHVKPRMSVDLAPSGRVLRPPRPGLPVPSLPPLAGSTGTASRPEAMISTGGDTTTQEPAKLDLLRSAPHLEAGLRVRMGMHCGLGEAEVADNKASGRITYPGRALQMAKAVSDAGRGGHVTLSSAVLSALDPRPGHVHYSGPYLVLQGGKCVLKEGQAPVDVLCAFSSALLPRAGHMEGLRCFSTKVPGTLQAPLGLMAVALAQVEDPDESAGWGLEASLASHKALLSEAARLAVQHGGYLVHTSPGSFQAAFTSPAAALAWLMDLQEDLDPGGNRASMLSCSALASREATSGNMSVDTDSTTREAAVLTRAVAMARLSILVVRGGLDVGVLPATMGPTGEVAYAGTALKRATCLAANAAWHKILVSLEAVRGVLGEAHPLSTAIALHATQQKRRPVSGKFRSSVTGRDARQGYMDLLKAFAVAERSTSQTSQGGPGTAPSGQSPGVGASQYRGQSQSQGWAAGAPERPPLPPSKEGAAPLDLLAQPVPGTLPSASKNESSKAQDVVFRPGLRLVKHKGVLEACAVRRQGAAAVATPNATGTPLARDASSGSSPMCQQQSPALPSPLPEPSCAPASGPEPAAAPTPAEAHVSMWLRPSMEDRLRSAPSLKRVLGSLDE